MRSQNFTYLCLIMVNIATLERKIAKRFNLTHENWMKHSNPMNTKRFLTWTFRFILLTILYIIIWSIGSMVVAGLIPDKPTEPGLADGIIGLLILSVINTILIVSLIFSLRWRGWRLALLLALAYYGSFTFMTQIETLYFLTGITVSPELMAGLFIMGIPVPFIFIPLAVLICGRWKSVKIDNENTNMVMPKQQFILKLAIIAVVYLVIYWCAGYFIAWQNPELRAFYGSPGEIMPFWEHTLDKIRNTPSLIILQLVRGLLFAVITIPVIRGSNLKPWPTALLVGLLLAVPHLVHILSNPLMPIASVRFSHMIETASSTFLFGLIVVWLLHRRHQGVKDLL